MRRFKFLSFTLLAPLLGFLLLFIALPAIAQENLIERLTPQDWASWVVVFLTIAVVEGIKRLLPSPDGEPRWAAKVTDSINRILPYLPIAIAAVLYVLWHRGAVVLGEGGPLLAAPIGQQLQHGAVLGIYAAYIYRAGKVTIFGK